MNHSEAIVAQKHLQGWLNAQSWAVNRSPKVEIIEVMGNPALQVTITGFQDLNMPTMFRNLSVVYKGVQNERTGSPVTAG